MLKTDDFVTQMQSLLQDLRYVTTESTVFNAKRVHQEAIKINSMSAS